MASDDKRKDGSNGRVGSNAPARGIRINKKDSFYDYAEKGADSGEAPSLESAPPKPMRRGKPKQG